MTNNPLIDSIFTHMAHPPFDIELPSGGMFDDRDVMYNDGFDPSSFTVLPSSALEELTFDDPLLLMTGSPVESLIRRAVPGIASPGDLCECDVSAILVASRIASRGRIMEVSHKCPNPKCEHENEFGIDLLEHLQSAYRTLDKSELASFFTVTLPGLGHTVRFRFPKYKDTMRILCQSMLLSTRAKGVSDHKSSEGLDILDPEFMKIYSSVAEDGAALRVQTILSMIQWVRVDETRETYDDRGMLEEWVKKLPSELFDIVQNKVDEITERSQKRNMLKLPCQKCGEEIEFLLELDPQKLFTSAGASKQPMTSAEKPKSTGRHTKRRTRVSSKSRSPSTQDR